MYLVDYHSHPNGHGENYICSGDKLKLLRDYVTRAEENGIRELGFSDHDWVLEQVDWSLLQRLKNESRIKIRSGIEIDYFPEKEVTFKKLIDHLPLDYCIGSVHSIGDWEVDDPDYVDEYEKRDIEQIYRDYFTVINQAVNSGLFDIIGHLDLIKIFDFKLTGINILEVVEPVLKAIRQEGLVMEINTNGLNKPVNEIYPSEVIIKRAVELGIPITLGSDAHTPQRIGEGLKEVAKKLEGMGCSKVAVFEQRKMKLVTL